MKYITGIFALNIEDNIDTCGDWHTSALNWKNIREYESNDTIFKDWGIEPNKEIPEHTQRFNVANTLRAVLDLMIDGQTRYLKFFRNDFFCTDKYNREFFEKVIELRELTNWNDINKLMKHEFMFDWDNFLKEQGVEDEQVKAVITKEHTIYLDSITKADIDKTILKALRAFNSNNNFIDLYDIIHLFKKHEHELREETKIALADSIFYDKELVQYILRDNLELLKDFGNMCKSIGIN